MTTDMPADPKGKGKSITKKTDAPEPKGDHLPWVEKYRPITLDEVTGQDNIISTVRKFIAVDRLPHLLFYGPPGTGKTTTILAIARELYGVTNFRHMVLELNASDDRGIDVVRNQIKTFASTRQMFSTSKHDFKLVILDEADAMTSVAQNALRRVIEKYTSNTRFCIIANYAHKINAALLSRCTRFRFSPMSQAAIHKRLDVVIESEGVKIDRDAREALELLAKGDMRKALNVLQPCFLATRGEEDGKKTITLEMVYECVGCPQPADVRTIVESVMKDDWSTAVFTVNKIKMAKGLALADILEAITVEFESYELKPDARIALLEGLSEIEFRLSGGGSEKIQTSATIGVVKQAIDIQGM